MEVREFELNEKNRNDLEKLLFQLSGKERSLRLENHPNIYCVGAFDGETLVGFAQIFILRKTTFTMSHLEDVVVLEEYRGRGIGAGIMKVIIKVARREGASSINLTTRAERKEALALYESLGFVHPGNKTYRLLIH